MSERENRFGEMRANVRKLHERGVDRRERRERVIAHMASDLLEDESEMVKSTAVNKYFKYVSGDSGKAFALDAVHAANPGGERATEAIVTAVSEIEDTGYLVAKKSRDTFADANRTHFRRKERTSAGDDTNTKEAPTSVKSALFWGYEQILKKSGLLGEFGKLNRPFVRVAVHGMTDRNYCENLGQADEKRQRIDFVIGGGSLKEGKQHVDPSVADWFAENFLRNLHAGSGEMFSDACVAVEYMGKDEADVYRLVDGQVIKKIMPKIDENGKKSPLSGAGLGLEDFRYGHVYEVDGIDGERRFKKINGFGHGFQTIQLEIAKSLRVDGDKLPLVNAALAKCLNECADNFDTLEKVGL